MAVEAVGVTSVEKMAIWHETAPAKVAAVEAAASDLVVVADLVEVVASEEAAKVRAKSGFYKGHGFVIISHKIMGCN